MRTKEKIQRMCKYCTWKPTKRWSQRNDVSMDAILDELKEIFERNYWMCVYIDIENNLNKSYKILLSMRNFIRIWTGFCYECID